MAVKNKMENNKFIKTIVFITNIVHFNVFFLQNYMFCSKDDLKEFGSQMYAVVMCQQSKELIKDSMDELLKNLNHKVCLLDSL